jgi:hypothetical protein
VWPQESARKLRHAGEDPESGFAAVDALVALTILATTLALGIAAVSAADRDARGADALQRASALERSLIDDPEITESTNGREGDFDWRIDIDGPPAVTSAGGLGLCQRHVDLKSHNSGRHYALASASLCAPKVGA